MTPQTAQKIKQVKVSELIQYINNARTHSDKQITMIASSIKEFGFNNPILCDGNKGVIAGHGRLLAANKLGMDKVPVIELAHLTENQKRAYILADNKLAELSGWDEEMLEIELDALQSVDVDISLLGFEDIDFDSDNKGLTDPDEVPEIDDNSEPITKTGDLWILGNHRLLCGDSTKIEDVERLMNGEKAGLCFTSPPYAMQRKGTYGGIEPSLYPDWFCKIAGNVYRFLSDDGSFFVNIKEHVEDGQRSLYVMKTIIKMTQKNWRYVDQIIWAKPGIPGAWADRLKNDFEPVHFFTKKDSINYLVQIVDIDESRLDECDLNLVDMYEDIYHFTKTKQIKFKPRAVGHKSKEVPEYKSNNIGVNVNGNITMKANKVSGIARPSNVLQIQTNQILLNHPAMFPVKLPEFFIKLITDLNFVVYEPFSGSGTTLIACEKTGRRCFGMEISPKYVDVAVLRWEDFTGKKAVKAE